MVHSTDSQRRSSVKRRGSKRLTVDAADRLGPRRDAAGRLLDRDDPRRDDPRGGHVPRRLVREAGGT